jgi:hypothetical protein
MNEFTKIHKEQILKMTNPLRDYSNILTCRAMKKAILAQQSIKNYHDLNKHFELTLQSS